MKWAKENLELVSLNAIKTVYVVVLETQEICPFGIGCGDVVRPQFPNMAAWEGRMMVL